MLATITLVLLLQIGPQTIEQQQAELGQTPQQDIEEAVKALSVVLAQQPDRATNTRFLSFANVPQEEREQGAGAVSYVLNSVSDGGFIERPQWVSATLLQFNLRDYNGTEQRYKKHWQAWEDLAAFDYVYHIRTRVSKKIKRLNDKTKKEELQLVTEDVTMDAPWIEQQLAVQLREKTASIGCILRVEQWLAAVTVPPVYHVVADVPPTEAEFVKQLGLDIKTIGTLDGDKGANIVSGVALGRIRRVASFIGPLGMVWQTKDVFSARGENDAIRQPLTRTINPENGTDEPVVLFRYDASEWIAANSNGLHRFALYDASGKRQDAVPLGGTGKTIAKDTSETHPGFHGAVEPMLSCVRCHVEDGLRPFDDVQSTLSGFANYQDAQELRSFYSPAQVQLRLKQGRESYIIALKQATDLNAQQVSDSLGRLIRSHEYELVTPERAAIEIGMPVERFKELATAAVDPYLRLLGKGVSIHRDAWRDSFALAASMEGQVKHAVENN